jgi:hypothetical protein
LSWANWAINRGCQFARHWSRKPILRQVLEMVAGDRNVLKIPTIPFSFNILRAAA